MKKMIDFEKNKVYYKDIKNKKEEVRYAGNRQI